jgi:hypothetical protein
VLLQAQTLAGLDPELLLELAHRNHCSSPLDLKAPRWRLAAGRLAWPPGALKVLWLAAVARRRIVC